MVNLLWATHILTAANPSFLDTVSQSPISEGSGLPNVETHYQTDNWQENATTNYNRESPSLRVLAADRAVDAAVQAAKKDRNGRPTGGMAIPAAAIQHQADTVSPFATTGNCRWTVPKPKRSMGGKTTCIL